MTLPCETNIKRQYYKAVNEGDLVLAAELRNEIQIEIAKVENVYKRGIRPVWLYKGFPKDETRPLEKVVVNVSTRLCEGSPFYLLVMFRQYFGAFMSAFVDANLNVGSAIGLNPYKDWDELGRLLTQFDKVVGELSKIAGDYAGYDTSLRAQMLWEVVELVNRWYGVGHSDNLMRTRLWAEIINSRHIYCGEVYEWNSGMPSGNPLTALINTICNNLQFRIAWQQAGHDASLFNENVYLACLGDDNISNIARPFRATFNEMTLPDLMAASGMTYTTETKSKALQEFRSLDDVEFLKRSFRHDPIVGKWVAPLRIDALFTPLNWTDKGISRDQIAVDKVTSTISELSLHGKKIFNTYARQLHDLRAKHYPDCRPSKSYPLDYDYVFSETINSDFMW
jgi:hypothetical protein